MTTNVQTSWVQYLTDGIQLTFAYNFLVRTSADMQVWWEGQLLTQGLYTVTGVGLVDGGTVVFVSPLPPGDLLLKRATPSNQLTEYLEGDAFPADSHEEGLDKLTRLIQDLHELLGRIPQLPITIPTALRNLLFPWPGNLQVLGWNANSTALTLFDSTILQVTVGTTSHLAWLEVIQDVDDLSAFTGLVQIPIVSVFQAGTVRFGALVRVKTTLGNGMGLTTFSAGSPTVMDQWGTGLARTATVAPIAANNPGMWPAWTMETLLNSENVVLTADGGVFDGTGALRITATMLTMGAA